MCRIGKCLDQMDHPDNYGDMKWRHIAALVINHKIVSIGSCNHRTRVGDQNMPSIHAELHAIMLYVGSHNIKNLYYNNNKKKKNNKRYNICNSKNKKYEKMLRSLQNAEIIVVRKPNSPHIDHYLESRPCNECVKMMKKLGIKKVHYSNEDGKMITEKVKVMDYKHNTPGNVRYKKNLFK
jgi:deoxycytidylate deaminase